MSFSSYAESCKKLKTGDWGLKAVTLGRQSGDHLTYISALSSAADALHQVGKLDQSKALFAEGIAYQLSLAEDSEEISIFVLQGYHYFSLLLTLNQCDKVIEWCNRQINTWMSEKISILTSALDHLSLVKALLDKCEKGKIAANIDKMLEDTVSLIRKSRDVSFLPDALLTQARYQRLIGRFDAAKRTLERAKRLTNNMPKHFVDARIEEVELQCTAKWINLNELQSRVKSIDFCIKKMAYHRRSEDIHKIMQNVVERNQ